MNNQIVISASLIRTFLNKGDYREVCYKRIKATRIDRVVTEEPTDSMLKGLYFEGQIIGSSAGGRKYDLPRKINGEKTAAQERIDIQVMRFRQGIVQKFMSVSPGVNTQVKVYKRFNDHILLSGEFDIFPTPLLYNKEILPITVVDTKLTADLSSDWGEYCWGRPEDMDHVQMIMYNYLLKDFDIPLNQELSPKMFEMGLIREELIPMLQNVPVFYWVFEHGKHLRNEIIKVGIDNLRHNELRESIRKVAQIIIQEDEAPDGWKATPSFQECKRCPLNFQNGGICRDAEIIKEV